MKQLIDLTHPLTSKIPTWDCCCGFQHTTEQHEDFVIQKIEMQAGVGTHIDAPAHCIPNGRTVDQLTLEELIVPCYKIELTTKYVGDIEKNSLVIIETGWGKYWNQPEKYHSFPAIPEELIHKLLEREIAGIGVDTLSPDQKESDYPVHKLILGADKYIIENVANAHLLPPTGARVFALPIHFAQGTEAPIRLIAT